MSLLGSVWDVAGELLVWSRAKAAEVAGKVQLAVAANEDRDDVEVVALPGFYSVVSANDELLILRRDDGGVAVGARTERPSGATAGDRGIIVDDVHLRIRSNMVSARKVTGSAPKAVALNGDDCQRNANMITWMLSVETAINAIAPGAVVPYATYADPSIADVDATAKRLEAD